LKINFNENVLCFYLCRTMKLLATVKKLKG